MTAIYRKLDMLCFRVQRLKTTSLTEQAYAKDEPRFHTIFDLVLAGLVLVLPVSLFLLSGTSAKDFAGPSAILATLFAAMASGFAGLSYSELRARVYRLQAPAYEYMYRVVGELPAFVIGWLILLHHIVCSSAVSKVFSQNLDYLVDGHISNFTLETVGSIPHLGGYLDFIGLFICLLTMLTLVMDISLNGTITKLVISSICIFVLIFSLVVGLYHLDFDHWRSVESFFPKGIDGIMAAAAILNYAFWGSERILRSFDMNSRGGRKPAMMSILTVHIFMLLVLILLISTLTLLADTWSSPSPFPEAFSDAGIDWMKYIICPAALVVLPPGLLWQLQQAARSLALLGSDGLIPETFASKNKRTGTELISIIFVGVTAALGTLLFSVTVLVQVLALPIIIMQIAACTITIFFHYKAEQDEPVAKSKRKRRKKSKPETTVSSSSSTSGVLGCGNSAYGATQGSSPESELSSGAGQHAANILVDVSPSPTLTSNNNNNQAESSDTDIDDIVEEYTQEQRVRELTANASPDFRRKSTASSYRRSCIAFGVFMIFTLAMSLIVVKGSEKLTERNVGMILGLFISLVLMSVSGAVIARQPRDTIQPYTVKLYVSHVPWTPLVALVMNTMMAVGIGCGPTVTVCIWIATGCTVYVFYGIKHSHESQVQDHLPAEHRGLIHGSSAPLHRSRSAVKVVLEEGTPETVYHAGDRDDDALLDCS